MEEKEFTLFWLTGKKELVTGENITIAVNKHYGGGAMRALDFWANGNYMDSDRYVFNKERHMWVINLNCQKDEEN